MLRRIATSIVVLFGISIALFVLLRAVPGDPASMFISPTDFTGDRAQAVAAKRAELGLDQPTYVQYVRWLEQLVHGNLGVSYQSGRPVTELIGSRVGATAYLMIASTVIALFVGVTVGVVAALRRNTVVDFSASVISLVIVSMPTFFIALLGIYVFGLKLGWLPTAGMNTPDGGWLSSFQHLIMPATILGLYGAAGYARWARSSMLDVLNKDYLLTARSKGLSSTRVVVRHGLHNAMIPLVTVFAMSIPSLFAGSVIIEQVFAWPGTGRMALDAIGNRDYPVVIGFVMLTAALVYACNLLADLSYALIDPRVRI
jgi:ABC-type dipeptide/oligopeptide/nickel transport system permease component